MGITVKEVLFELRVKLERTMMKCMGGAERLGKRNRKIGARAQLGLTQGSLSQTTPVLLMMLACTCIGKYKSIPPSVFFNIFLLLCLGVRASIHYSSYSHLMPPLTQPLAPQGGDPSEIYRPEMEKDGKLKEAYRNFSVSGE